FANEFPNRSTSSSICQEDLSGAMTGLAMLPQAHLASSCLEGVLAQPIDCAVSDVQHAGKPNAVEHPLPACDASATTPCWRVVADPANCQGPGAQKIDVVRPANPPTDTTVVAECVTEVP